MSGGQTVKSLLFGMRVARARSEEEAKTMLARVLLGPSPWSDRWVADSAGEVTTTVPIVGVGIRRTEF